MSTLANWNSFTVPQRHETGCIPTGYEWLIRYLNIRGVNFSNFQEDFDLGQANNFTNIAAKIEQIHPFIKIQVKTFAKGADKVERIKQLINEQTPCLMSLALGGGNGWHIMPVVKVEETIIEMVHHAVANQNHIWSFQIRDIIWRHDNLPGGNDISWVALR
jgi:hypothetical protein